MVKGEIKEGKKGQTGKGKNGKNVTEKWVLSFSDPYLSRGTDVWEGKERRERDIRKGE